MATGSAPSLVSLLHELDGQLGLGIHREHVSEQWRDEAIGLRHRIRAAIQSMEETDG